jgi:hypothetical protein
VIFMAVTPRPYSVGNVAAAFNRLKQLMTP